MNRARQSRSAIRAVRSDPRVGSGPATAAFVMAAVDGGEGGPAGGPVVAKFLDLSHGSRGLSG